MRKKTSDMTLEQLQKRLREAHAKIGQKPPPRHATTLAGLKAVFGHMDTP